MKLRVQYPLWNIIGCIPLFIIGWGVISLDRVDTHSEAGIFFQSVLLVGMLLLVLYFISYTFIIIRHNKRNPFQKVNPFSLHPNEFVEDDEMFKQVTMSATKKVYSFIYWALPALLGMTIFSENRLIIYVGIIVIIIVQNLMYYREMKKYYEDESP